MIDKAQALKAARDFVNRPGFSPGVEIAIEEGSTVERPFGWVFFYNSKRFVETGDRREALDGNAPIIVDRRDGSIHPTGTARPLESYIEKYEREHPFSKPVRARPSRPSRFVAVAIASLAIALILIAGWLRLPHSAVDSVPVLTEYAPKDPDSIIEAVSLSSSMTQDFDTNRVGTKFDVGIRSAVLWYRWHDAKPGQALEIVWSKDDSEVLRQQLQISSPSGSQAFALRTPDGSALPEGRYQVALVEAGKTVTSIPFQIGK